MDPLNRLFKAKSKSQQLSQTQPKAILWTHSIMGLVYGVLLFAVFFFFLIVQQGPGKQFLKWFILLIAPWYYISSGVFPDDWVPFAFVILPCPIYGYLVGIGRVKKKLNLYIFLVVSIHALGFYLCYLLQE